MEIFHTRFYLQKSPVIGRSLSGVPSNLVNAGVLLLIHTVFGVVFGLGLEAQLRDITNGHLKMNRTPCGSYQSGVDNGSRSRLENVWMGS